jgi:hypothetical protein
MLGVTLILEGTHYPISPHLTKPNNVMYEIETEYWLLGVTSLLSYFVPFFGWNVKPSATNDQQYILSAFNFLVPLV